jgi:aspartate/methionine/tyrosine aminotransferase
MYGTAVVPGAFFGSPAHFRISFGGATDRLAAGLEAIARCLGRREG